MDRELEQHTTSKGVRILMLEDQVTDAELCERALKRGGLLFTCQRVDTRTAFEAALDQFAPDLIISDFSLPAFDGLEALELAQRKLPEVPFMFVSGTIREERAMEAMTRGATDYVLKDRMARLGPAVLRALERRHLREEKNRADAALRASEARYRNIFEAAAEGILLSTLDGRLLAANPAAAHILGYGSAEELVSKLTDMGRQCYANPNDQRAMIEQLKCDGEVRGLELRHVRKDGTQIWISSSARVMPDEHGRPSRILSLIMNISQRKRAEAALARADRMRAVLSGINSVIVRVTEREQLLREACRIAVEQGKFGLAWIGILDQQTQEVKPKVWHGSSGALIESLRSSMPEGSPSGEGTTAMAVRSRRTVVVNDIANDPSVIKKAGPLEAGFRALIALPLIVDEELFGVFKLYATEIDIFDNEEVKLLEEMAGDISFALDHLAKQERIDYLAYYDSLTGLPNRTLFLDRAKQFVHAAGSQKRLLGVIVLNLDRFGIVNETMGRHAGDALLKLTAERIKPCLSDSTGFARLGADVYAIVLANVTDEKQVARFLEAKLMVALGKPFLVAGEELRISAKAGIALFPGDGADADTLLHKAEIALQRAKNGGDQYLFYAANMNARVMERLSMETRLRKAIEEQQFVLHYQPKVDLRSGLVTGLEALIRWQDPQHGLVAPGSFIPILEETGMMLDVGKWALRRAALDYAAWLERGLQPPRVTVNVSQIQLRQNNFVADVKNSIQKAGRCKNRIGLEITESMIMQNIEANISKLKELREADIEIAIDDFGTGYSSLSHIAKLPVTALKIDRSFIVTMTTDPDTVTIVSTIISLAHSLRLKVVAEGVDAEEQGRLLRLLGCDEMQGYLFSKPLPMEDVEQMLQIVPHGLPNTCRRRTGS